MRALEKLRVVLFCSALQLGVMMGVPMRPDEIEQALRALNQPNLAHLLPADAEDGEGPPDNAA